MRNGELDFFDAFSSVGDIVAYAGLENNYYRNLAMLYLFSALGAVPTVIISLKNMKNKNLAYKI